VNRLWLTLGRKCKADVKSNPHLYSMLFNENGVVMPGGR
jgi:hypothetical protein